MPFFSSPKLFKICLGTLSNVDSNNMLLKKKVTSVKVNDLDLFNTSIENYTI